jgi:hypothetical protein
MDDRPSTMDVVAALTRGDYLVELAIARPIPRKDLLAGLAQIGFSRVVTEDPEARAFRDVCRFIGRLGREVLAVDTDRVRWLSVRPIGFDAFRPVEDLSRMPLTAFSLEPERPYEMRIVSRVKAQPTRRQVEEALTSMGWSVARTMLVEPSLRPRGSTLTVAIWYGEGTWDRGASVVTPDDPFYFDALAALAP